MQINKIQKPSSCKWCVFTLTCIIKSTVNKRKFLDFVRLSFFFAFNSSHLSPVVFVNILPQTNGFAYISVHLFHFHHTPNIIHNFNNLESKLPTMDFPICGCLCCMFGCRAFPPLLASTCAPSPFSPAEQKPGHNPTKNK